MQSRTMAALPSAAGPSRRQQAQLELRQVSASFILLYSMTDLQRSDNLDITQPDFGLTSPITPTLPGSFGTLQLLHTEANRAAAPAEPAPVPAPADSPPADQISRSPFSGFAKRLTRLVSPSQSTTANTPSNKRGREAETPVRMTTTVVQSGSRAFSTFSSTSFAAPAQVTPAAQFATPTSSEADAARQALVAFEAATPGNRTAQDYHILSMLSKKVEEAEEREAAGSQSDTRGSWAASTFEGTPRLIRPLRSNAGTPGSVLTAPASPAFSVGTSGSVAGTPRGQKVYLGPGMSSRRLKASRSNLRDNTPFNPNDDEENIPKRRRTGSIGGQSDLDSSIAGPPGRRNSPPPPVPAIPAAARSAIAIGKQRAANIMIDLVDAELGPLRPERPSIIVNPYDRSAPPPAVAPGSPASAMRSSTPARSILRKSTAVAEAAATPTRGVGARLEHTPGSRPTTTLEILQGRAPWDLAPGSSNGKGKGRAQEESASSGRHVRIETPERERDDMEVEDLIGETPSKTAKANKGDVGDLGAKGKGQQETASSSGFGGFGKPATAQSSGFSGFGGFGQAASGTAPTSSKSTPAVETPAKTKPLEAPQLSGMSSFTSPSRSTFGSTSEPTPSFDAVPSSFTQSSSPAFTPTPVKAPAAPEPERAAFTFTPSKLSTSSIPASSKPQSAKDLALQLGVAVLPFFTFNVTIPPTPVHLASKLRERVMAAPVREFTFTTDITPAPAPAASTGGFNWSAAGGKAPAVSGSEWTCSRCGLKNDDSAMACTICEADRPGSTIAAPAAAAAAPTPAAPAPAPQAAAFKPFDFAAAGMAVPQNAGGWVCGVCMVSNKADAVKCVSCEADKP